MPRGASAAKLREFLPETQGGANMRPKNPVSGRRLFLRTKIYPSLSAAMTPPHPTVSL